MTKKSVCLGFMAFVVAFDLPALLGTAKRHSTGEARQRGAGWRGKAAAAAVRAADNGA